MCYVHINNTCTIILYFILFLYDLTICDNLTIFELLVYLALNVEIVLIYKLTNIFVNCITLYFLDEVHVIRSIPVYY